MKAIGYARCSHCNQLCAGYAPRHWKPGDQLHVWQHVDAAFQTGWGRQAKCVGSYKAGTDTHLTADMQGNREP